MEDKDTLLKIYELENQVIELRKTLTPTPKKLSLYTDVCDELNVSSNDSESIKLQIQGFDFTELSVVKNLVKMMRISKVYNRGWFPKAGEKRYFAWFEFSSSSPSGLRFLYSGYDDDIVNASSASHLCFKTSEDAEDAAKKFPEIYAGMMWPKIV